MSDLRRGLAAVALVLGLLAAGAALAQNPASYGYNPYSGYYGPNSMYNPYTGNYAMGRYGYNPYTGGYGVQTNPRYYNRGVPNYYSPYIGPNSSVEALRNPYTGNYGYGYRMR